MHINVVEYNDTAVCYDTTWFTILMNFQNQFMVIMPFGYEKTETQRVYITSSATQTLVAPGLRAQNISTGFRQNVL